MDKRMGKIDVKTRGGKILILGEPFVEEHDGQIRSCVDIAPEQVDLLVKWLNEAKDELLRL